VRTAGLSIDQAPTLVVPLRFFLTAPWFAACAGGVLLLGGGSVLETGWAPLTLGATHLGTLGFLTMVMLGALYQMLPVIAGSPVPWPRIAGVVWLLLVLTVAGLAWGMASGQAAPVFVAIATGTFGFMLFLVPVGIALWRAPARNDTVRGMAIALGCLALAAIAGLWMAHGHSGMRFPGPRALWLQVHLSLALLGWVGGLIAAVSWQVLPMFYLAREVPPIGRRSVSALVALGAMLAVGVLALDLGGVLAESTVRPTHLAAAAAAPAAIAVLVLHPLLSLRALSGRRRTRVDWSLLFWRAGLCFGLLAGVTGLVAHFSSDPRVPVLFGWLVLWGWAGMIMHGMLTRIVPFLIWLNRFAPLIGEQRVPSIRTLLPDNWTRRGFRLHVASVVVGALAILSGQGWLAHLTGLLLLVTALDLARSLLRAARHRPEPPEGRLGA
jgi:hypothetical protein